MLFDDIFPFVSVAYVVVGTLLMPRNRLLAQLDDELLRARESLRFWRDQLLLLDGTELQVAVKRQVMHREAEIRRLLETQEILIENGREYRSN